MANPVLRSNCQHRTFHLLGLFCLMVSIQKATALQFAVGGAKGWAVPDNSSANGHNQWAERTRFQIGDSLLFVYQADQDSVLQVTKENYENCTTTDYIKKFDDGHTVFTFNQSGPYYFISGNQENCKKNEKLLVVVLADRSNRSAPTYPTSPASPPTPDPTETVPSPAPAGEESPPAGTVEINPSPAPVGVHPSTASSTIVSVIGSVGALLIASSLTLVF